MEEFLGFPEGACSFLEELEENNEKEWFELHKARFKRDLQEPMLDFIVAMGERLETIVPDIIYSTKTNGSGSLMRIYRDVRFSKDKTPYKTALSALFWEGHGKKTECPAFGFRLTKDGMQIMAGMHSFPKATLQTYRDVVDDDKAGKELVLLQKHFEKMEGYELKGEHFKRVPRGYEPEHPRERLLRFQGLYVHPAVGFSRVQVASPDILELCYQEFEKMLPLQQWLVKHLVM